MINLNPAIGILVVLTALTFISCSKDDPDGFDCTESFQFSQAISDEAQALTQAASTYSQNPTTENCENYREAARNYLDEAERYRDCAHQRGQGMEFDQAIESAENDLDNLDCQ